jgi:hypothetical protein
MLKKLRIDNYLCIVIFILYLLYCPNSYSQILTKGRVTDTLNKPLINASVTSSNPLTTVKTNINGEFILTLPEGKQNLSISFVGYKTSSLILSIHQDMPVIEVKLEFEIILKDIEIIGECISPNSNSLVMGVDYIKSSDIKKTPALLGENDILKSVQLTTGVQATSEGNTGFSVRGGSPDQNLIQLDHNVIYNTSHLAGFLSVFNNDIIKDAILYKGCLPVKYGGRLASVLDISTVDKYPEKIALKGGIGLCSSKLTLEIPCKRNTWLLLSGRRSYADIFTMFLPNNIEKKSILYFYDINFKLTQDISEKDKISLSCYSGIDHIGIEDFKTNYGNKLVSFIWQHNYNSKISSNTSIAYSNYMYNLKSNWDIALINWKSNISDQKGEIDFTHRLNQCNKLSYGFSATKHSFHPCNIEGPNSWSYEILESQAEEWALYLANEERINEKLKISYGIRSNFFNNKKKYTTIDPRLSSIIILSDNSSFKISYGHNSQFIQWASRSNSGSPLDVWFPASLRIPPQKTIITSAGFYNIQKKYGLETSLEIYSKNLHNIIDFADNIDLLFNNNNIEELICKGSGKSYGLEIGISKKTKYSNISINYTYAHTEFIIPGINNGKAYLSPYDKPHSIYILINYKISKKISLSSNWVYSSGKPGTFPSAKYKTEGIYVPVYSGRNNYRYPDYHRLDFSINYQPMHKNKEMTDEWTFSVYNAYARKNPWAINFKNGKSNMIYLFSIVPSITYNFKF